MNIPSITEEEKILKMEEEVDVMCGAPKKVRVKNEIFLVSATSLNEISDLQKLLTKFESIPDDQMLNDSTLNLMAKIILYGLKENHPDITIEEIRKKFPLSAFPTILQIILDLNDFLSGMGKIRRNNLEMVQMAKSISQEQNLRKDLVKTK